MDGSAGWVRHPLDPVPRGQRLPEAITKRLAEWRATWEELWYLNLGGKHYVLRTPTRRDAIEHDMNAQSNPARAVDRFVSQCVLYPAELPSDMRLEYFNTIYDVLWDVSSFKDPDGFTDRLLEFQEVAYAPDQEHLVNLVRAFQVLPDEINSWQPNKLMYHMMLARRVLGLEPLKDTRKRRPKQPAQQPPPQAPDKPKTFDWNKDLEEWRAFERS
jgi:hypothetical protein